MSTGVGGQGGWRVLPTVEGVVTFDARVMSRELEAMDDAEVRVTLARGTRHTFRQAVVMRQAADGRVPNTYALHLDCYEAVN